MAKPKRRLFLLLIIIFPVAFFLSCNTSPEVPFPAKDLALAAPVTVPLQFTAGKKLLWDTVKRNGITPVIKKLDIDALPSRPYDSTAFKPFSQPPSLVHFDYNTLPDTIFSLQNLPSNELQFKTSVLKPPVMAKAFPPALQKGKTLSIFDFGQFQGLPAKFITCLLRDKSGFMWIASSEGLYRYDGEHIQTFIGSTAAPVMGLVEDKKGNIWFITYGGIGMIDRRNGTISNSNKISAVTTNLGKMSIDESGFIWVYNVKEKAVSIIDPEKFTYKNLNKKAGLSDSAAYEIMQDDLKNIWITTYTGGVDIIDAASGKIKYLRQSAGLGSDTLSAITKDKAGQVWIAGPNGSLNTVSIKQGTIVQYGELAGPKKKYTLSLSFDSKGYIWMGTTDGIVLADPAKGKLKFLYEEDGLSSDIVPACVLDNYNKMWIATTQGLNIIDQSAETVHLLGSTRIISMMEDAIGNLWVASDKGIQIINAEKNVMRTLNRKNGLANDFVQSFAKFGKKMYVATNGGFNIIDPVLKTIAHIGKKEGLVNDTVYALLKDRGGNIWLSGPSKGIDFIDSAKKIILHTERSKGLSSNSIADMKQDNDGLIWLATVTGGVDVYDPKAGTIKYLNSQPGLKDTCSKMFLLDHLGRMWTGSDKGIYIADTKQHTLTAITTKQGLSSNRILSLFEYGERVIVGTNHKANIITDLKPENAKKAQWKVSSLVGSENLVRQQANSWSTDCVTGKGQFLWGDVGITAINRIEPPADSAVTYITGINVMTESLYFVDSRKLEEKDTLWASDTFYVKGEDPKTRYKNTKGSGWDSVTGPYNMAANLHLSYDHNYLQFQFAQLHLNVQDSIWYSYILEGIDKKWSAVSTNPFTENYLNLPPGNYTFKVCSKGASGNWTSPASFSFTISPPWYKTWWAFTLFAILCLALLRAYIVYRSRKLQKENKALEEKITLRTSQLQKSIEDLKATQMQLIQSEKMASLGELTVGIAHEIQNPLNFVNNFSEVSAELIDEMEIELNKGDKEEAIAIAADIKQNLQKITEHGKRADAIVKGMLQHSRSSTGAKELTDINALCNEYLRLSYHGLRAKDKSFNSDFKTDFNERIEKITIMPQDIGRVLLNLFNNAFYAVAEKKKKADINYKPLVSVTTKKENDKIVISVYDNGMGIQPKVVDKIFQPFFTTKPTGQGTGLGLSLSYDIIKAHGGELKVETKEGEGATFIIQLPVAN